MTGNSAVVVANRDIPWSQPPGHFGAYSKYLVNEETGCKTMDFRVSLYPPRGFVEDHVHAEADHVYFILDGEGLMTLGEERRSVGPGTTIFVPRGVRHGIMSNGIGNLHFVVVTSPAQSLPMVDTFADQGS